MAISLRSVSNFLGSRCPTVIRRTASPSTRRFSTVVFERDGITIPALNASFPLIWLRDSCQCPSCVHPSTRQKLHRSSDFARSPPVLEKLDTVDGGLKISWSPVEAQEQEGNGGRERHESFYPVSFLAAHAGPSSLSAFHRDISSSPWTSSLFSSRTEEFPYASLSHPETLLEVYRQLRRDGLVFFSGVPTEETSDERCELRELANRLSVIRRTFYGETWDVRNVRNSKNIAYTNLDLGLHMDLLYFKEPPRYQILHALRNRVYGGQSLFVDALHAAQCLQTSSPEAFETLATTPVPFHYINDGHHLHHSHPTFEVYRRAKDCQLGQGNEQRELTISSINYSPPFQAPLPISTPPSFYAALSEFVKLVEDPQVQVIRLLREGDAVVFDNRRVLHGRAAFSDIDSNGVDEGGDGGGEASRWLKGCYLEEDPVSDRMRVLSQQLEKD